jgi:hypothetical protein
MKYYNVAKEKTINYNDKCPLLEPIILKIIDNNPDLKRNTGLLLRYALYNLFNHKEAFARNP